MKGTYHLHTPILAADSYAFYVQAWVITMLPSCVLAAVTSHFVLYIDVYFLRLELCPL